MRLNKQFLIVVALVFAYVISLLLEPDKLYKDVFGDVNIEESVPTHFNDWVSLPSDTNLLVDPSSLSLINQLYSQTLSRTYENKTNGTKVMLSIAYGEDQSDTRELHIPDACYPSQGFQLSEKHDFALDTNKGKIKARRMVAVLNQRVEPLTYWVMLGNYQVRKGAESKIAQLKLGLNGYIPDGFVIRVSSISNGNNYKQDFSQQELFINDLVSALDKTNLYRLTGITETNDKKNQ